MAAVSVFRVAVVLFFCRLCRAAGDKGEPGLHVFGLLKEKSEAELLFLHSACRLNHTNIQVVRGWCTLASCAGLGLLRDRLRSLPEDDWVILNDLRQGFTHVMARPQDVKDQLIASGHSLILDPRPHSPGLKEAMEKQMAEALKGKEGRALGEGKGEGGKEEEAKKTGDKAEVDGAALQKAVYNALKGGSVIGRVGVVLKVLEVGVANEEEGMAKEEEVTKAFTDTKAEYVFFGGRQLGEMSIQVPIRVKFIPAEGAEGEEEEGGKGTEGGEAAAGRERPHTTPFLIHTDEEKPEIYNMLEAMGEGPATCPHEVVDAKKKKDDGAGAAGGAEEGGEGDERPPRVLVAVLLAGSWAPFLREVLQGLEDQDYPKDRMGIWIHAK
ncbi:uncharacterized protein LOC134786837, partial [Penaeus indicus]|uniref:uncharacterized protein LOC134786837 n=1 Tax=Penaeus indicus TaxID=29960 RepID=UPI00300D4044